MHALEVIFQILLVFAPHVGYLAQYLEIVKTNSIEGYAPLVSLILLTSNTLRLYYYIGRHYMLALLFQAFFGVIVHFILLLKVLEVHVGQVVSGHQEEVLYGVSAVPALQLGVPASAEDAGGKPAPAVVDAPVDGLMPPTPTAALPADTVLADGVRNASSPVAAAFLRCRRFVFQVEDALEQNLLRLTPYNFAFSYSVSACVALVVVIFYYLSIGRLWHAAPEVVGYISLSIEALLVVPQILRNARRRSTQGLSIVLILSWAVGDIIKVIYYSYAKQALPFIICGIFQVLLDVVVVVQLGYYRFYLRRDGEVSVGAPAAAAPSEL
jgi:solute carrier family 66, member 2